MKHREPDTGQIRQRRYAIAAQLLGGEVAVCAGFQGIAPNNRIATLGRGGSDTLRAQREARERGEKPASGPADAVAAS